MGLPQRIHGHVFNLTQQEERVMRCLEDCKEHNWKDIAGAVWQQGNHPEARKGVIMLMTRLRKKIAPHLGIYRSAPGWYILVKLGTEG